MYPLSFSFYLISSCISFLYHCKKLPQICGFKIAQNGQFTILEARSLTIKVLAGLHSFCILSGKNPFLLLFQPLEAVCLVHCRLTTLSSSIFTSIGRAFSSLSFSLLPLSHPLPLSLSRTLARPSYKDPCDYIALTQIIQNNLPISTSFI